MAKYSFKLKKQVVQAYLDKKGSYSHLSRKYGVKTESQVRKWVNAYQILGEKGLLRSRENKKYPVHFKLTAIELYLTTEMSYREIANQLKINNPSLLANWIRAYRLNGTAGLHKPKGRPLMNQEKKLTRKKSIPEGKELSRLEELENENQKLRIENAFLKESRRLRLEDERKMREHHESSTVSEDNFH